MINENETPAGRGWREHLSGLAEKTPFAALLALAFVGTYMVVVLLIEKTALHLGELTKLAASCSIAP